MNNSKRLILALFIFFLSIIAVVAVIVMRKNDHAPIAWWEYVDMLSIFLASFAFLVSSLYNGKLPAISRKLAICSRVLIIFAFLWDIVAYLIIFK